MELLKQSHIPVAVSPLEISDILIVVPEVEEYIIKGEVDVNLLRVVFALERKEAHDFLSSLIDGRLNEQLHRMSFSFYHSFIILEGTLQEACAPKYGKYGQLVKKAFPVKVATKALIHAALKRAPSGEKGAISILHSESKHETVRYIEAIANTIDKGDFTRLPKLVTAKTSQDPDVILQNIVGGIPGISDVLTDRILKKFKTVQAVALAEIDELREVEGIGKIMSQLIYNSFRREFTRQ